MEKAGHIDVKLNTLMKRVRETSTAMKNIPEDLKGIQVEHHVTEQSSGRWSLPSSSSRNHIDCVLLSRSERSDSLLCRIQVKGEFWRRGLKRQSVDLTNDFEVVLPQVLVDIDALKYLRERLVEWQVNPSGFNIELGVRSEGDQQLSFSIGQDKDLIYSTDKPAATISYSCGASMNGKWAWVVDQSCIRLCAESIRDFIRVAEAERAGED